MTLKNLNLTDIREIKPLHSTLFWGTSPPSIESDLAMRFEIWDLDLTFHDFAFFKHSF